MPVGSLRTEANDRRGMQAAASIIRIQSIVRLKEEAMKYGARNKVVAKVKAIRTGDIMSLVKFDVTLPAEMASVLTTESLQALDLEVGQEVQLVIKAIHVLPVKE
jgi:molybdopterin-binding protein